MPSLSFTTISIPVAMAIDNIVTDPALKLALETSAQTREQAIALLDLVSSHPPTSEVSHEFQIQISKQQKLLLTYLAQLRGLHRDSLVGARETKALTAEARQEVDKLHLQLQNLYYEQRHLQGEINACASYEYDTFIILNSSKLILPQPQVSKTTPHSYRRFPSSTS
jgi:THO complex subunit 5